MFPELLFPKLTYPRLYFPLSDLIPSDIPGRGVDFTAHNARTDYTADNSRSDFTVGVT